MPLPALDVTPSPAADELAAHIRRHHRSQREFALLAGISEMTLSHYLTGRRGLSPRVASAVRRAVMTRERRSRLSLERLIGLVP